VPLLAAARKREVVRKREVAPPREHRTAVRGADRNLAALRREQRVVGRNWDRRVVDRSLEAQRVLQAHLAADRNLGVRLAAWARPRKAARHPAWCLLVEDEELQREQEQLVEHRAAERPRVRVHQRAWALLAGSP